VIDTQIEGGIVIVESFHNLVCHNTVASNFAGISILASSNNNIIDNDVSSSNVSGFEVYHSNDNIIHDNRVTLNSHAGIWLVNSSNNAITYNNVSNNSWQGIFLGDSSDNNEVSNNLVIENGNTGIFITDSSENSVSYNNVTLNVYCGIQLGYSENSNAKKNVVTLNSIGIMLHASKHNVIEDNKVTHNGEGILLAFSNCNRIEANEAVENGGNGIRLYNSSYNEVSHNNASIDDTGIVLETSSNNNTLVGNNVASNYNGILVGYSSNNNTIYHNNFLHNTVQVVHITSGCVNVWDNGYPSDGNFWSDYVDVDIKSGPAQDLPGSDGIGDTPYIIDADNHDHYPLMNPYGAPPPPTYALTITTTVGGTTDPSPGTYSYTANSSVQVTATPNADYTFDHWELDTVTINVYVGISYDPNYTGGLLVMSIVQGGPADKAGLTVGDVIKQVDSLQVNRAEDFKIYVERYRKPGDTVVLKIDRSNLIIQITLTLEHAPIGSPNPYTVLMDYNHALKAVFTYSPPPPQLTASISPLSASILVGQSVTFTSTVSGGYTPYSYQWYLNGNPVSGATSTTWTFTPTTSGICYIHLKVTDAEANTAQSDTARITFPPPPPVGGYSIPIQVQTRTQPIIPYMALIATLTLIFMISKQKTKRRH
jgi:parallel beta-helix repeat protein